MKIGLALSRLAEGSIVSRRAWENEKGHPKQLTMVTTVREHDIQLPCAYLQLGEYLVPWTVCKDDIQADDWYVVWDDWRARSRREII